ncbi:single-stranded DNA-binding protein [Rhodococcoides corynebacterioides]|uniref:Single-stranded DNA-binding protein n=1 Tax=Rhodococcoides corynebacterioides TaxID=53972 RepID=A0ABS7P7Z7_9NOCA|nr:single-stranded DNA-binding protein [Rhodococcus corynebacterioides]MBY6368539.1 single-stranded DNA-binding protein [Rhodococcus corynebacterioides]MBY6409492.1 single-stranded DNA-binding protein [Rhodococcus corynebacterioides]
MNDVWTTVVGTVITDPIKRTTQAGDEVLGFRVASNSRRQDRATGDWIDGDTLYASVSCWRRLVSGVGASLMKGDPVIVYGRARTSEYTTKEGVGRSGLEITATAVGPDLSRCQATMVRPRREPAPTEPDPADSELVDAVDDLAEHGVDDARDPEPTPVG